MAYSGQSDTYCCAWVNDCSESILFAQAETWQLIQVIETVNPGFGISIEVPGVIEVGQDGVFAISYQLSFGGTANTLFAFVMGKEDGSFMYPCTYREQMIMVGQPSGNIENINSLSFFPLSGGDRLCLFGKSITAANRTLTPRVCTLSAFRFPV